MHYVSVFGSNDRINSFLTDVFVKGTLKDVLLLSLPLVLEYYENFETVEEFNDAIVSIITTHYESEISTNNTVFKIHKINNSTNENCLISIDDVIDIIKLHIYEFFKTQSNGRMY